MFSFNFLLNLLISCCTILLIIFTLVGFLCKITLLALTFAFYFLLLFFTLKSSLSSFHLEVLFSILYYFGVSSFRLKKN